MKEYHTALTCHSQSKIERKKKEESKASVDRSFPARLELVNDTPVWWLCMKVD